jgi:ligand-binding sensor domain-containing protein
LTALLVCWAVASSASAQYRLDSFTISNGLPQNTVAAVFLACDGVVWIRTYDERAAPRSAEPDAMPFPPV